MDISKAEIGFTYTFECIGLDGKVKWTEVMDNIIPDAGRDYIIGSSLMGVTQYADWYIGLYSAVRTPIATDTMTTLMADAVEVLTYSGSVRLELVPDALSGGIYSNIGTPAEFTATAATTVNGGFITSSAARGSTAGLLLSAAANPSPKPLNAGEILRVSAGLSFINV
jgi:hypothetical protein